MPMQITEVPCACESFQIACDSRHGWVGDSGGSVFPPFPVGQDVCGVALWNNAFLYGPTW